MGALKRFRSWRAKRRTDRIHRDIETVVWTGDEECKEFSRYVTANYVDAMDRLGTIEVVE